MADDEVQELLFKVLVVGDMGTGKTATIRRYVNHSYSEGYKATIGVDFALKEISWDNKTLVRLQLWDIAGQERYGNMTRVYYKEAIGAFIVFDITNSGTFEAVKKWKDDIDAKVTLAEDKPIPVVLLANKCDLVKTPCNKEVMDEYCKEHGFVAWFATSAKENINIDKAVDCLIENILQRVGHKSSVPAPRPDVVPVGGKGAKQGGTGCCG